MSQWKAIGNTVVDHENDMHVCGCATKEIAEQVAREHNAHEALVEASSELVEASSELVDIVDSGDWSDIDSFTTQPSRSALKLAKDGGE